MPRTWSICNHCHDVSKVVTPLNGRTLLANTSDGQAIVALHRRCEKGWVRRHPYGTLVSLREIAVGRSSRVVN